MTKTGCEVIFLGLVGIIEAWQISYHKRAPQALGPGLSQLQVCYCYGQHKRPTVFGSGYSGRTYLGQFLYSWWSPSWSECGLQSLCSLRATAGKQYNYVQLNHRQDFPNYYKKNHKEESRQNWVKFTEYVLIDSSFFPPLLAAATWSIFAAKCCKSLQLRFPPTQPMICWEHSGKCDSYPAGWGCCEMLAARCRWLCSGHKPQASLKEMQKSQQKLFFYDKRLNLTKKKIKETGNTGSGPI